MITKDKILKSVKIDARKVINKEIKPLNITGPFNDPKPNLYLPWRGEFGWFCRYYVPIINSDKSLKYICADKSKRHFFKNAILIGDKNNDFSNDKFNVFDLNHKLSIRRRKQQKIKYDPVNYEKKLNINVDIALAPRFIYDKEENDQRNWCHWKYVKDSLKNNGFKVACVGIKEQSVIMSDVLNSWDFQNNELGCLEIMHNAKLIVSMNSGICCMCYLFNLPCLVIPDKKYRRSLNAIKYPQLSVCDHNCIKDPDLVLNEILILLSSK